MFQENSNLDRSGFELRLTQGLQQRTTKLWRRDETEDKVLGSLIYPNYEERNTWEPKDTSFLILFCHSGIRTVSYWKYPNKCGLIILLTIIANGKALLWQLITHEVRCHSNLYQFSRGNSGCLARSPPPLLPSKIDQFEWQIVWSVNINLDITPWYIDGSVNKKFKQLYQMPQHITNSFPLCFCFI